MDLYEDARMILNNSQADLKKFERVTRVSYNTLRSIRNGTANPVYTNLIAVVDSVRHPDLVGGKCADCTHLLGANGDYGCSMRSHQTDLHNGCAVFLSNGIGAFEAKA
jgi:hypothetical protein